MKYLILVMLCIITFTLLNINENLTFQNMTPTEKNEAIHQQELSNKKYAMHEKQLIIDKIKREKEDQELGDFSYELFSIAFSKDGSFSDAYEFAKKPENKVSLNSFLYNLIASLILCSFVSIFLYRQYNRTIRGY